MFIEKVSAILRACEDTGCDLHETLSWIAEEGVIDVDALPPDELFLAVRTAILEEQAGF